MAKKFDVGNIKTGRVFSELEQATGKAQQQDTASPEEVKTRRSRMKTQGRKGAKAIRINMAFTPENHHFIKVFASSAGLSMTQACNKMLDYARNDPKFTEAIREKLSQYLAALQPDAAGGAEDGAEGTDKE